MFRTECLCDILDDEDTMVRCDGLDSEHVGAVAEEVCHDHGPRAGAYLSADFIGIDVCVSILDVLKDGLGDDKYRACPLLRRMVAAGHLGRKSGRGFYEYDR